MDAANSPMRGTAYANPVAPPPQTPLNQRLATALQRLETQVMRTENILNRLRAPGPTSEAMMEEPSPYSHELADRFDIALDRLDRNTNHILDLL